MSLKAFEEVQRSLGRIAQATKNLTSPTGKALDLLKSRMQEYPPEPPNSTYERTGTLQSSWGSEMVMSGATLGRVFSDDDIAPYNVYVQDEENQAAIHQDRWQTYQEVADEKGDEVLALFEDELVQLVTL
jgi:hypothetical protein